MTALRLIETPAERLAADTAVAPDRPLPLLFANYLTRVTRRVEDRNGSDKTIFNNRRTLRRFADWLAQEGIDAEAVDEETLRRYLKETVTAQSTKRLNATIITAAYHYAHRKGTLAADPFADYDLPAEPIPTPGEKIIPAETLRKQKGYCRTIKQALLWALLVYTGMRLDEIRRATWEAVDWNDQTMRVLGKGKKWRTVPIHPVLLEIMLEIN